jgi:hypothetical protein
LALGGLLLVGLLLARAFGVGFDEMREYYDRWRMRVEGRYKGIPGTALEEGRRRGVSTDDTDDEGLGERTEELHTIGEDEEDDEEATRELEERVGVRAVER